MQWNGFCGGSYQSFNPIADNERSINWFPETIQTQGVNKTVLHPTPGIAEIGSTATAIAPGTNQTPGKAHLVQSGREFAVIGTGFYEINSSGAPTFINSVALDGNPATLSSNGEAGGQIMITSGGNVAIYNFHSGAFTNIPSLNGLATMGDSLDGYFIILDADTSTCYFSGLNDGLTWTITTNFFKRSLSPDPWVAMKVVNRYIWLLGQLTSEVWYNAGTFPLPFAPYVTSVMPYGCVASFSVATANGAISWLGSSKAGVCTVLQSTGFSPTVISTYALSNVLNGYSKLADAIGDTYTSLGHTFYLLSFPEQDTTICYDSNSALWHDRGTWISENSAYVSWRPRFHAFAYGQHRMLDSQTGKIYHMDESFTTDVDSRVIRRLRQPPPLFSENERLFISAFELDLEAGLGNTVDPASDPQVMMRISNDGGKTFGIEHMRSAGKIGEYTKRVRWTRCGQGRRRVFEVSVSNPVPWKLIGAYVSDN
jgi:Phage stabilisation protein